MAPSAAQDEPTGRPAQPSPSGSHLPTEVLTSIVNELDPVADCQTLLSLLRVSQFVWEVAARHLYRSITISDIQLSGIVDGLSKRMRACLGFIHRLKLFPPPEDDIMAKVYKVAGTSGAPLFPNVRRLILNDMFPSGGRDRKYGLKPNSKRLAEPGVLLFDTPDVCVQGATWSQDRLEYLPCRSISSSNLTVHCSELTWVWESALPRPYRTLSAYWAGAGYDSEFKIGYAARFDNDASRWAMELPIMIYAKTGCHKEPQVSRLLAQNRSRLHLEDKGHVRLVFDKAPPCAVCCSTWNTWATK